MTTSPLSDPLGAGGLLLLLAGRAAPDAPPAAPPSADFSRILDTLAETADASPDKGDAGEAPAPVAVSGAAFSFAFLGLAAPAKAADAPPQKAPDAAPETATVTDPLANAAPPPAKAPDERRRAEADAAQAPAANAPPAAMQAPPADMQAPPPPIQPSAPAPSALAPAQAPAAAQVAQPAPSPSRRSVALTQPPAARVAGGEENGVALVEPKAGRLRQAVAPAPQAHAPQSSRDGGVEKTPGGPPSVTAEDAPRERIPAAPLSSASAKSEAPPEASAPLQIRVSEIVTHLPAVVAQTLTAARDAEASGRPAPILSGAIAPPPEKPVEPLKILKFQVEPASLGAITVRMRVSRARVEIALDADSPKTSALLLEARDHLASAIGEKGMTLESFHVGVSPPPAALTAGQEGAGADDRPRQYGGERGFANEERPDQRQNSQTPPRDRQGRGEKPAAAGAPGVLL
ncbi:flagellar hook-length control protein FliK [Methylocystis sp. IM3]|uniref:flagellar hook-length control protein FliK n=1 Tax=Methylocystis sp. IM3 TaxID=3136722 RepID=UPI0031198673